MIKAIISRNIRCRVPGSFEVGEASIIDDFCYFSTQVRIGRFCHIANGVSIAGGRERRFILGDFSSISAGAKIWCSSDDFVRDMACLAPPGLEYPRHTIAGDVQIDELTIVGSNAVIMPSQHIPIGVAIGALSFIPPQFDFRPWSVYAGIPIRLIRPRDKKSVLAQRDAMLEKLSTLSEPTQSRGRRGAGTR
jgi:acetyltransferase-like isoleucine patch superfamily enzyme